MKTIYSDISKKTFKQLAILSCFIGDLLICLFLWYKYTDKDIFRQALNEALPLYGINHITEKLQAQTYALMIKSFIILFSVVLILHAFIYMLYYLEKKSAYFYVKCLAYIGLPGSLLLGIQGISLGSFTQSILILQAGLYLYVVLGLKKFPRE